MKVKLYSILIIFSYILIVEYAFGSMTQEEFASWAVKDKWIAHNYDIDFVGAKEVRVILKGQRTMIDLEVENVACLLSYYIQDELNMDDFLLLVMKPDSSGRRMNIRVKDKYCSSY